MYNRCIIPEIGDNTPEWKAEETKESRILKQKQKELVRQKNREDKKKLQEKYIRIGAKNGKKTQRKRLKM